MSGKVAVHLRRIDLDSGDLQHAGAIAANCQPRALDAQLLERELEQRQRRPGNDQLDLGQGKEGCRRRAGAIEHVQTFDHELRVPAVPAGGEHGDFDGVPELPRQHARERVPMGFDLRKDDEADSEQNQRERRESDDQGRPDEAEQRKEDRAGNAEKGAR